MLRTTPDSLVAHVHRHRQADDKYALITSCLLFGHHVKLYHSLNQLVGLHCILPTSLATASSSLYAMQSYFLVLFELTVPEYNMWFYMRG